MKPSGAGGAAKEGVRRSVWTRVVREGPGVSLEELGGDTET